MLAEVLVGGALSVVNFGLHAAITGLIVLVTRHIAARTDGRHVFVRLASLLTVTAIVLMIAHMAEIGVWAGYYTFAEIRTEKAGPFAFAFENYTALGYGDAVPPDDKRLLGPITALNGLLLIGWSVAIIFEVMRMAEVQIGRKEAAD